VRFLTVGPGLFAISLTACGSSNHPTGFDASDATPATDAAASDAIKADVAPGASPDVAPEPPGDAPVESIADAPTAAGDAPVDAPSDGASDVGDAALSLPSGTPWHALAIATGLTHACALLDNHRVKCWGANAYGCLGTGDGDSRGPLPAKMGNGLPFVDLGAGRTAVAISAGRYTTCAILDTGDVKCWGLRMFTGAPAKGGDDGQAGNQPSDLGDALPALDLGTGRKAVKIAQGYDSSCAVLDDGTARCWGGGSPVAPVSIDQTHAVIQLAPAFGRVVALFDDGRLSTLMPVGVSSLALADGQKATYVAGSQTGACAVLSDGHLACSPAGESVPPGAPADIAAVDLADDHACVLTTTGQVRCWGTDCDHYPPGTKYWCPDKPLADGSVVVALGQPATALGAAALDFSCALLADGSVRCWTSFEQCTNAAGGGDVCAVPDQVSSIVGGAVTVTGAGANRKFGPWRSIDLGTRP
jgi:Regulator of chromosome condensation (RCC1) repeat